MCELYGFTSAVPVRQNDLLKLFFSHSVRHPHGWGMARLSGETPVLFTEPCPAFESKLLPKLLEEPVNEHTMIAHIRLASMGSLIPENCHPFTGKDGSGRIWTLMHNGTIFNGPWLRDYAGVQKGSTDSERILLYLLDTVNAALAAGEPMDAEGRFRLMDRFVSSIAEGNKLNLMFYDGEQLYVHTNMAGTLYARPVNGGRLFVTAPLDETEDWTPVTMMTLMAYRGGEEVFRGTSHGHLYTPGMEAQYGWVWKH